MKKIRLFVCLLVISAIFTGCTPRKGEPFAQESSDLQPDPKAVFGVLDNGMRYIFYPNSEPKGRLFAYLGVAVGSAYETEEQRGIAHFIEHMAFNGSKNFKPGAMVKYFQSIGMNFGGDVNAFTGIDQTAFSLDLPDSKDNTLRKSFMLFGDYARRLMFLQDEIERERGIILAEMRDRDSVQWRAYCAGQNFTYGGATIANRMPIGLKDTVDKMNRPLFLDFYNTWYRPERMTLIVVGDIEFSRLKPYIEKEFAGFENASPERKFHGYGEFDHDGVKAFNHYDAEAEDCTVSLMVATQENAPADSVVRRRYEAARDLVEGILNRRLEKIMRREGSPFISAGAYSYWPYNWARRAGLQLKGRKDNWRNMLQIGEQELRRIREHGFTDFEFAEAKKIYLRRLEVAAMKAKTRDSRQIASNILSSVGDDRVFLSADGKLILLKDYIEELSAENALAAFRRSWVADHMLLTVVGNAKVDTKDIVVAYNDSLKIGVAPVEEKKVGGFAYGKRPENVGTVITRNKVDDLGITQTDFSNGARLNLKKTDFKKNEVKIKVIFGKGKSVLPLGKEGLAELVDAIMVAGGLGRHSAEDLRAILAGRSANVGFKCADGEMVFTANTVPEDMELAMQLVRAYMTDPGYREEAVRMARNRYENSYKQMLRMTQGVSMLKVNRMLTKGDIRFGAPELSEFMKRTSDDVRVWVNSQLASSPVEVSIVGDIDEHKAEELAAIYFGSLPKSKKGALTVRPVRVVKPCHKVFTVPTKIERTQLFFFWKTSDQFSDISRARRLSMLGSVFDEYLRTEVREKIGGAYSPYAYSNCSSDYNDYGTFVVSVSVEPKMEEKIREAVMGIARQLYSKGTTEDVLQRMLLPTIKQIEAYRRTNGYWMNVLCGSAGRPQQIEWARSFINDYQNISLEDANKYAKRYLNPDKVIIASVRPENSSGGSTDVEKK